jgi:hypothetical protein
MGVLQLMLLLEQAIETLAFVILDEADFHRVEPLGAGITMLLGCFHPQAAASEGGKKVSYFSASPLPSPAPQPQMKRLCSPRKKSAPAAFVLPSRPEVTIHPAAS